MLVEALAPLVALFSTPAIRKRGSPIARRTRAAIPLRTPFAASPLSTSGPIANTPANPGFQYAQFGTELRHLANNLKLLSSVISKAQESLRSHSVHNSGQVRWDQHSFFDIVGDFYATLRECENLLEDNRKLGTGPNSPLRNLE